MLSSNNDLNFLSQILQFLFLLKFSDNLFMNFLWLAPKLSYDSLDLKIYDSYLLNFEMLELFYMTELDEFSIILSVIYKDKYMIY